MTTKHAHNPPPGISRRDFVRLAALGLLTGCLPSQQSTATRPPSTTIAPSSTATDIPTRAPTNTPTSAPSAASASTATNIPTSAPTATSTTAPTSAPTSLSKVVQTHHASVWEDGALSPTAITQMLDASITQLTGLDDAGQAWASLFAPGERVAIKVNVISGSIFHTHAPLVMAVAEHLQAAGLPAEQIIIFDRLTRELHTAGYPVNQDEPGVLCYGNDGNYTAGWKITDRDTRLCDILLQCDALINIPILKQHDYTGISFALKNHYGSIDNPASFHRGIQNALPELNALPPIRERTRLIIGDALEIVESGWYSAVPGDSILMSLDPVAHDTLGLQLYGQAMKSRNQAFNQAATDTKALPCLRNGAELGLGVSNLDEIELVEVNL